MLFGLRAITVPGMRNHMWMMFLRLCCWHVAGSKIIKTRSHCTGSKLRETAISRGAVEDDS